MVDPAHTAAAVGEWQVTEDPMPYALLVLEADGYLAGVHFGEEADRAGQGAGELAGGGQIGGGEGQVRHETFAHRAPASVRRAASVCQSRRAVLIRSASAWARATSS